MQFNVGAAVSAFSQILQGQQEGRAQAASEAADTLEKENQQRLSLYQTLSSGRRQQQQADTDFAPQIDPSHQGEYLDAVRRRYAGDPNRGLLSKLPGYNDLPPEESASPGGDNLAPFPASEQAGLGGPNPRPVPQSARLNDRAGVLTPQAPLPQHYGIQQALQQFSPTGQAAPPQAPIGGPPPGTAPSGQPGPQAGSVTPNPAPPVIAAAFGANRGLGAQVYGPQGPGGVPPAPPLAPPQPPISGLTPPAPPLQTNLQPTAPAAVSVGQAAAPTGPPTYTPAAPPAPPAPAPAAGEKPRGTTYEGTFYPFKSGPPKEDVARQAKDDTELVKYASEKLAAASPEQAKAIQEFLGQEPPLDSLRTKEGIAAAQAWHRQLTSLVAFTGPAAASQTELGRKQLAADMAPLKTNTLPPLEAAYSLVGLLHQFNKLTSEASGGKAEAGFENPAGAGLLAYEPQIKQIETAIAAGDMDRAAAIGADVQHSLFKGYTPQQETAQLGSVLRLFAGMSTEARQDPDNLRAVLSKVDIGDRWTKLPDDQLVAIFGGGAFAEKARNVAVESLARLRNANPAQVKAVLDTVEGYSRAVGPDGPLLDVKPADFLKLSPLDQARLSLLNARIFDDKFNQADKHNLVIARLAQIKAQTARADALSKDPHQRGLVPVQVLQPYRDVETRAQRGVDLMRKANAVAGGYVDDYLAKHPNVDNWLREGNGDPPVVDKRDPDLAQDPQAGRILEQMLFEAKARQAYREKAEQYGRARGGDQAALDAFRGPQQPVQKTTALPGGGPPTAGQLTAQQQQAVGRSKDPAAAREYLRRHPEWVPQGAP